MVMKINNYYELESLEIVHIFDYYDFPLFYISKSSKSEYYLNYYIDEIQDHVNKWFFGRISNKERLDIIEQRISVLKFLNRLLKKGRLHHLFIDATLSGTVEKIVQEIVNDSTFEIDSFPDEDFVVEYDYIAKKSLNKVNETLIDSSMFKLVFKDEMNSHDIELNLFINLMEKFKKTYNGLLQLKNKIINETIIDKEYLINLKVDSFQPSSFGVWIKTDPLEADLFEIPEKSLSSFYDLLNEIKEGSETVIEESLEVDEEYNIETIKDMKNFLKEISSNKLSFTLEAKNKSGQKEIRKVVFNKNNYSKIEVLNEILLNNSNEKSEILEIEGVLTSINIPNNKFRLSSVEYGEIQGSMAKDLRDKVKDSFEQQFKVPGEIKTKIERKIINNHLSEEYTIKNKMISFKQE
jgi:formate dehydrogenase maturation protein FdhE